MNYELLIGIGLLLLGAGVIVFVAIAKEHPLIYLSGLGVAAMGAAQIVSETMSPGPARTGARILFSVVAFLAFWFQWRMARRLQQPRGEVPGQESGGG